MVTSRRWVILRGCLLTAAPSAAVALRTSAAAETTDLALTCDTAAALALTQAATAFTARTGVRVRVHATRPGLVLPQLEREIQNDILVTRPELLDQAERHGLVQLGGRTGPWRNRLVVAAAQQPAGPDGSFAAPDTSPASDIDGPVILRRLGIAQDAALGVIDTDAVAWLLTTGGARLGLLHQSDVAADSRLRAMAMVPDDAWPPILYAATVTRLARRPNPGAFVAFLGSVEGRSLLHDAGLESVA